MQTSESAGALMTVAQAAQYLGVGAATLNKQRVSGDGPAFVKLGAKRGGSVRYRRGDLDAYIAARVRRSTSEHDASAANAGGGA